MLNFRANRATLLLTTAFAFSCSSPTAPRSFADQFDNLWDTFDREYSYFELKQVDWNASRTRFRDRAISAPGHDAFVSVIREMLSELRDVHVKLVPPSGATISTWTPTAVVNWDATTWQRALSGTGFVQVKPNLGYSTLRGIPYIIVGAWNASQVTSADLDGILSRFQDAPALIVDVRPNGGGDDQLALALAARFADRTVISEYFQFRDGPAHTDFGAERSRSVSPGGPWQYTAPVLVLAGRGAFSATESFVAAMREFNHVTIVGDTTGGGSGNPKTFALGDGWSFTVSRWIARTADREPIEGRGIPPDVVLPWDPAVVALGRDPVLEAALAMLGAASR